MFPEQARVVGAATARERAVETEEMLLATMVVRLAEVMAVVRLEVMAATGAANRTSQG